MRLPVPFRGAVIELSRDLQSARRAVAWGTTAQMLGIPVAMAFIADGLGADPALGFYEAVAAAATGVFIAIAIDLHSHFAQPSDVALRERFGLLLGLQLLPLVAIASALTAIGVGDGSAALFGVTAGALGGAILFLIVLSLARVARASDTPTPASPLPASPATPAASPPPARSGG